MNRTTAFTAARLLSLAASAVLLCFAAAAAVRDAPQEEKNAAMLKSPTSLRVELARRRPERYDPPDEETRVFRPSENIYFEVFVTSALSEPVEVQNTNKYYQNRPELIRDGDPVPYREDVAKSLPSVDAQTDFDRRPVTVKLPPGARTKLDVLELRDWYETLKPGRYRLTNRRRFIFEGEWVETPSISFEVQQ